MIRKRAMKRAIALLLSILMFVALSPLGAVADNVAGHWSEYWIREAQDLKWIPGGNLGSTFNVDMFISRAELALITWQAYGAPEAEEASPYIDVDAESNFGEAFSFLYEEGVILGYGDRIAGPDDYVTREMLFTIVSRMYKMSAKSASTYTKFLDAGDVSDWAREHISALNEADIVIGDENGYVHPQDYITYAEFVKVLVASYEEFITDPLNPLGVNPNTPLALSAGSNKYVKAGGETEQPDDKTPVGPTASPVVSPRPGSSGGGGGGGGSLPPRGDQPHGTPPPTPVDDFNITAVHAADTTFVVLDTETGINSVTVSAGNQSDVATKGPIRNNRQEWRAVLDGTVAKGDISVYITP